MLSVAKQDKLQAHLQCKEFGTQGLFQWIGRLKFAVCWFTARSRIWSNNAATFRQTWQFLEMSPFHVLPIHWPHEKSSSIGTASNVKALRPRVFRQLLNMLSWQWQARKKNEKKHFFEKKKNELQLFRSKPSYASTWHRTLWGHVGQQLLKPKANLS